MNGDQGYWEEVYPADFYPTGMQCDGQGTAYPIVSNPPSFAYPSTNTGFLAPAHFSGTSHIQPALYLPHPNDYRSVDPIPELQQLCVHTRLSPHQMQDSGSSTTSNSSFTRLQTPSSQIHLNVQPYIQTSSPMSAPAELQRDMLMVHLENLPPLPPSPLTPQSTGFEEDISEGGNSLPPQEQDGDTEEPMPHIIEWKQVIELCRTGDFVPQKVYQPYTEADRKRYIQEVVLQNTILFCSENSSELGISLDDALKQRLKHLKDREDPMFVGCGPSVSIRVQWPGYAPWSKQIPTMDFKNPKGPITRAKLAKNIANCVRRFAELVSDKPMEADSDRRWKIGKRHIKVEDLILVSLHHVSKGSWQPQLRLCSASVQPRFSFQWDECPASSSAS